MKKLRIFSLLFAIVLILTNFSGVLPFLKDIISIPANAWSPTDSDWVSDQIATPSSNYAYTFAVVGDTQSLLWYDLVTGSNNLDKMYDWIVNESKNGNIDLVMGLGDITETNNMGKEDYVYSNGSFNFNSKKTYTFDNSSDIRKNEWLYAKSNIDKLSDNNIPYTIVRGNHDKPHSTVAAEYRFNQYFKYDEYASHYADGMVGRYDGKYEDGTMHNTYLKVEIAGVKYMIVNLDCGVSSHKEKADDILEWANRVVAANKDYKVIVTTHEYLSSDGKKLDPNITAQTEYYGLYAGQTIWDKFARKHENIFLILSGHHKTYDIGKSQIRGDNGNTVTQMMIDPQRIDMPQNYPDAAGHGPTGLVAMLHFSKDGKTLDVEYYSTVNGKYFRTQNQFSLNLNQLDNKKTYTDSNHTHAYSGNCDAICDLCLKTTRTASASHTYYNNCDPDCNVCNTSRNTSHSYTNSCDATCNKGCGTVRIPPHSYDNTNCSSCEFPTTPNGFCYTVHNNGVTITKYTGSYSTVIIPEKINGYPVTHIGEYAFENNKTMTSVTIPASVKTIGVYAFNGCSNLSTVKNNSTVMTAIGGNAFYNCSKLTEIILPSTLCYIGEFAFYGCSKLKSITLPSGFTAVERLTFYRCSSLTTLNMPNTLNTIRHHAFFECTGLTKLVMSSSLTTVERYAFCDCSGITTLVLPKSLKKIASYAFYCKNLKNIYYEGTSANKNSISIDYTVHSSNGRHNNALKNATWHYSACMANKTSYTHAYSTACDAECNNCLKTTRTASNHTYSNNCDPDCNICFSKRSISHTYDNSCDTVCNICSATRSVSAHVFSDNCDTNCNVCGAKRIAPHVYDNEYDIECNKCKATRQSHTQHEYDNDCDSSCDVCGEERTVSHTYSNDCDVVCDVCNETTREITEEDHTYEYPCSKECTYCKKERAAEHAYDNNLDPDCNDCGATREIDPNATPEPNTDDTTTDGSSSNTVLIIVIIAVIVIAAGVGIGCWIFLKKRK